MKFLKFIDGVFGSKYIGPIIMAFYRMSFAILASWYAFTPVLMWLNPGVELTFRVQFGFAILVAYCISRIDKTIYLYERRIENEELANPYEVQQTDEKEEE